jgi:hypothetical protein
MRSSVAREQEPSNKRSDDLPSELSIAVRRKNSGANAIWSFTTESTEASLDGPL